MVTATWAYGSHPGLASCRPSEPPGVAEVRSEFDSVVNDVLREFVNQSVHATALGIKALDAGNYITLDALEKLISKK